MGIVDLMLLLDIGCRKTSLQKTGNIWYRLLYPFASVAQCFARKHELVNIVFLSGMA
jgi:hypothetical protein